MKIFRGILLALACFATCSCAGTTTIDPAKCAKAQKVLDLAKADVKAFRDAGEMSSDDYRIAVIAEMSAQNAVILLCE